MTDKEVDQYFKKIGGIQLVYPQTYIDYDDIKAPVKTIISRTTGIKLNR